MKPNDNKSYDSLNVFIYTKAWRPEECPGILSKRYTC